MIYLRLSVVGVFFLFANFLTATEKFSYCQRILSLQGSAYKVTQIEALQAGDLIGARLNGKLGRVALVNRIGVNDDDVVLEGKQVQLRVRFPLREDISVSLLGVALKASRISELVPGQVIAMGQADSDSFPHTGVVIYSRDPDRLTTIDLDDTLAASPISLDPTKLGSKVKLIYKMQRFSPNSKRKIADFTPIIVFSRESHSGKIIRTQGTYLGQSHGILQMGEPDSESSTDVVENFRIEDIEAIFALNRMKIDSLPEFIAEAVHRKRK